MSDNTPPPGVIRSDECYSLDQAQARTGLGETAFRSARLRKDDPLVVHYAGNKAFVFGDDLMTFIRGLPTTRAK